MSFQKSNDGRVFFKKSGDKTANDHIPPQKRSGSPALNLEIVNLLKGLNDKLQTTQIERRKMRIELDHYRKMIETLQVGGGNNKTAERAYKVAEEALKELEETRRLMLQIETKADRADQGISGLKTQMLESRQQQAGFSQKLEDSRAEQGKLSRQITKTLEDRSRFMRKIERIEEAVLQTQDALNAKAMVLLTDQGTSESETPLNINDQGEILPDADSLTESKHDYFDADSVVLWWKRSRYAKPITVAAFMTLLVGAISVGLLLGQNTVDVRYFLTGTKSAAFDVSEVDRETAQNLNNVQNVNNNDLKIPETAQRFSPDDFVPQITQGIEAVQPLQSPDQTLDLMNETPEALAESLNAIEPSITREDDVAATDALQTSPLADFIKPDPALPEFVKEIQLDAFKGIPEAQNHLASIYTAGHGGVKQDYGRAAFWFEQAAGQNIANAAYNLGVLHHQGMGMDTNIEKAIIWYKKAADLGHPEAQYNLGIAHIEAIGVEYDPSQASQYFESAATLGVIEGAYNLGLIYENGLLGEAEPDKALMWYKIAADKGSPDAKAALSQLARSLDIKLEDVNRIAESMKALEKKTEPVKPASQIVPKKEKPVELRDAAAPQTNILNTVIQIQNYLMSEGLYPGPADGLSSPILRDAIRSYQAQNNLGITGISDNSILAHMLANPVNSQTEYGSRAE